MNIEQEEKIKLNQKKLSMMKLKIIHLEKKYVKTKFKTRSEVIDQIRKIIIDEAKKNI